MKIYIDIYFIFMCIYTAAVDTNMVIKTRSQVFFPDEYFSAPEIF